MSYERDKDKLTRGVGAIAALDHANPRRYRQRMLRRRAMEARDRELREYTYRPGGGIGRPMGLGMVNLGISPTITMGGKGGDLSQYPTPKPGGVTGPGGGGGATNPWQINTKLYGGAGTVLQAQPTGYKPPGVILPATWPTAGGITSFGQPVVGVIVDPVRPGAGLPTGVSTTTGGKTPVVVSGGSGGGGGGYYPTATTKPPVPGMEPPATPDIPDDGGAPRGLDVKKLALIGGAAFAAWWLFFRKPTSGGTP